jgi:serine/threonine-protein kinase
MPDASSATTTMAHHRAIVAVCRRHRREGAGGTTSGPGAFTTVPIELVGASASEVAATLADAGPVVTVEAFHPTVTAGQILQVSPGEDARIRKDATVTLTVSKGPDLRAVSLEPAGEALDAVEAALTTAGFEVVPEHVYSDTVPAGTVISATGPDSDPVTDGARLPVGT